MFAAQPARSVEEIELDLLLEGIFRQYGFDFRDYALSSLRRRILEFVRQEGLSNISSLHDPASLDRFVDTLSVHVSAMFRDPGFYLAFRKKIVPLLRTYPFVRIWQA